MAASKDKAVLFGRVTHNRTVHQWPIAVFNDAPEARMFASMLKLAYTAADDRIVKALSPSSPRDEAGALITDPKFSVVVVPYAPRPELDDEPVSTGPTADS